MIYSGSSVLLYLNVESKWVSVGGMRATKLDISNQIIEASDVSCVNPWRKLMENAGTRFLSIAGTGVFSNSEAENYIQKLALSGSLAEYKIVFGGGSNLSGNFIISNYQRVSDVDEEENYIINLVSSGEIFYVD